MSTPSVIDDASLSELVELDRLTNNGVFQRVVGIYLERAPALLQELTGGVDANDAERVFTAAHSLKSSSANVGAKTLSELCRDLEQLGRGGSTAGAPALLAEITTLYQAVAAELRDRVRAQNA